MITVSVKSLALFLALAGLSSQAQSACLALPTTLSGTLLVARTQHPNGTPITAYQIRVASPLSVEGMTSDGCVTASLIQVLPADKKQQRRFAQSVGKTISIISPDVFEAHTAWHIGEAVALQARVLDE